MPEERRQLEADLHELVEELHVTKQPNPWILVLIPVILAVTPVIYYAGKFETTINGNKEDIKALTINIKNLVQVQSDYTNEHVKMRSDTLMAKQRSQDRYDHLIKNITNLENALKEQK